MKSSDSQPQKPRGLLTLWSALWVWINEKIAARAAQKEKIARWFANEQKIEMWISQEARKAGRLHEFGAEFRDFCHLSELAERKLPLSANDLYPCLDDR